MIYTAAEAEFNHHRNAYEAARPMFYAGKVTPADYIAMKDAMNAAADAWYAEREASK